MKCAVLGASGLIGQQFVRILANHPYLSLEAAYSSSKTAGKSLEEVWGLPNFEIPENVKSIKLKNLNEFEKDIDIAFSGLPTVIAIDIEKKLSEDGIYVFSNASAYRMDDYVPILIPEINRQHIELVKYQQEKSNSDGFIIANANCSVTGAAIYLAEMNKITPINSVVISSYQAMSGAGLRGVGALEIANNVIPFINEEEKKVCLESKKILGEYSDGSINPLDLHVVANCARVPVIDGHLEAISIFPKNNDFPEVEEIIKQLNLVKSPIYNHSDYYIAPENHLNMHSKQDRPQPVLDAFSGTPASAKGMSISIGRIRADEKCISAYILVHNTIRGGAGGSILNAEFAKAKGLI